jgi:hypothetical protein
MPYGRLIAEFTQNVPQTATGTPSVRTLARINADTGLKPNFGNPS